METNKKTDEKDQVKDEELDQVAGGWIDPGARVFIYQSKETVETTERSPSSYQR